MLEDIKFIGDISIQDADVLLSYARVSDNVLEFGCGGSTQVFAQAHNKIKIISVDTSNEWIDVTRKNVNKIGHSSNITFLNYTTTFTTNFDLIFVDGVDELRKEFAIKTWKKLKIGGVMIFHDTRRQGDAKNALDVALTFHNEIESIHVNKKASNGVASNLTILLKKIKEPYVNWNLTENKPTWAYNGLLAADNPLYNH